MQRDIAAVRKQFDLGKTQPRGDRRKVRVTVHLNSHQTHVAAIGGGKRLHQNRPHVVKGVAAQFDQDPGIREIGRARRLDAEHVRNAHIAGESLRHRVALVHGMKMKPGKRKTRAQIDGHRRLIAQLRRAEIGHTLVTRGGHHQIGQETIHDRPIRPAGRNAALVVAGVAHGFVQRHVFLAAEGQNLGKLEDKLRVEFPPGKDRGLNPQPRSIYAVTRYDQRRDARQQTVAAGKFTDDFPRAIRAGPHPQTKGLGKAVRLEAIDSIPSDRGHQHDLIEGHRVTQFDLDPLVLVGRLVTTGTGSNGPDPAAEVVIRQLRQLTVDLMHAVLQRGQREVLQRGGGGHRGKRHRPPAHEPSRDHSRHPPLIRAAVSTV